MDYAIVKSGGLQYRVSPDDRIRVPRLRADVGGTVELPVLAVRKGSELKVGAPLVGNASVSAEVVRHGRAKKIIVFKKKRKKGYQVTKGHRQEFTELKIRAIAA